MQRIIAALLAGATIIATALAQAQTFPSGPVKIVVPFPAGGGTDQVVRVMAPKLSALWGQPVIIDNKPGAGGNIGAAAVAQAAPDGQTLLLGVDPIASVYQLIYKKLPYDFARDLAPVATVLSFPSAIVVNPSVPARTLKELADLAKAQPGKLNYGSFGAGSAPQLSMELFKSVANVDITHVPYKGNAEVFQAMLAGDVQVTAVGAAAQLVDLVNAGKLRVLGVDGVKRSALLPDVPTFTEAGFPRMKGTSWFAVFAPAKTPKALIDRLSRDINAALNEPEVRAFLTKNGFEPGGGTPEDLARRITETTATWAPVIKANNIGVD